MGEDECARLSDLHVGELLAIPGVVAARRYLLEPAVPGRPPVEYRHLVIYVLDGPPQAPDDGARPEWLTAGRSASLDGRPLEDGEPALPDHGYLTFSHAPARFTREEYFGWYYAHARENLTSEGLEAVWRYALTPVAVEPNRLGRATHASLYAVRRELSELHAALEESIRARRVDIPDWLPECEFTSLDCRAAGPLRRAAGA
jgi:hypothetical protein